MTGITACQAVILYELFEEGVADFKIGEKTFLAEN